MGLSEEQVRRKARSGTLPRRVPGIKRYLWLKSHFDQWYNEGQPIPKIPTSPIQEKALAMCKRKDHSWMKEEEYEGNSYLREPRTDTIRKRVVIGFDNTCYFCNFTEYHRFGS